MSISFGHSEARYSGLRALTIVYLGVISSTIAAGDVQLVLDPQRQRLYLADEDSEQIRVFEATSLEERPAIALNEKAPQLRLLMDVRANRILVYSPVTMALQIVDPDARAVVDQRTVKREGAVDVDPVRSHITHYSDEGLRVYDYEIRRVGEMPAAGQWISRVDANGTAVVVSLSEPQGYALKVIDLETPDVVRNFALPSVDGRYVNETRKSGEWIALLFEARIGVSLVAVRLKDSHGLRVNLPWRSTGPPILDGNRYFMPATDGHQNALVRVDLGANAASRIPVGEATAFAVDPGGSFIYTANETGAVHRIRADSGRPFRVFPKPLEMTGQSANRDPFSRPRPLRKLLDRIRSND